MAENEKQDNRFPKIEMRFKDILSLIRPAGYCYRDDVRQKVVICLECEEWTWAEFTASNGLLDFFGDLIVESISVSDDGAIQIWVKTDDFNFFNQTKHQYSDFVKKEDLTKMLQYWIDESRATKKIEEIACWESCIKLINNFEDL